MRVQTIGHIAMQRLKATMRMLEVLLIVSVLGISWGMMNPENVYQITPMKDQPGIYYERVITLRLQHVDWRVAVFIDVKKFIDDFPKEEEQFAASVENCRKVATIHFGPNTYQTKCSDLLNAAYLTTRIEYAKSLVNELENIARDSSMIKSSSEPMLRTMRKRSVPLGFIGSLSKSLFGTMNEEDAEYINSQIDKLFSDQTNLTRLIGKQMHVTRSKLQQLHEEHVAERQLVHAMGIRLENMQQTLGNYTKYTIEAIFRIELVSYARRVEDKLDRYVNICEQYLRVITAAKDGRYEPTVLTAAQLLAVSGEIQRRVPEFEFPLAPDYLRGEILSRIARADLVIHSGRMLIVTHIPLLDRTSYNLFRMHPWPVPQKNINQTGSAHLAPATTYIAVSADRRSYFLADSIYIDSCRKLEQKYICTMETPLHEVSTSEQCEIVMLTRPSVEAYRLCNVRVRPQHGAFWAHLPSQGGWLYSLEEQETIHVLCPGLREISTTLEGSGIFHLSSSCVARTRSTALTGIRTYDSREQYFYTPEISLNITIVVPGLLELTETMARQVFNDKSEMNKQPSNLAATWKLQENGDSLFEIEQRIEEIGTHRRDKQSQHYLFLAGFSLQGFLMAFLIIYLCRSWAWKLISRLCRARLNKRDVERRSQKRKEGIESSRESKVSTRRSYRFPSTSREKKDSMVLEESKKTVATSSGIESEERTAPVRLPRQNAEVDE